MRRQRLDIANFAFHQARGINLFSSPVLFVLLVFVKFAFVPCKPLVLYNYESHHINRANYSTISVLS
jgi:hypothetical protein